MSERPPSCQGKACTDTELRPPSDRHRLTGSSAPSPRHGLHPWGREGGGSPSLGPHRERARARSRGAKDPRSPRLSTARWNAVSQPNGACVRPVPPFPLCRAHLLPTDTPRPPILSLHLRHQLEAGDPALWAANEEGLPARFPKKNKKHRDPIRKSPQYLIDCEGHIQPSVWRSFQRTPHSPEVKTFPAVFVLEAGSHCSPRVF